MTKILMICHGNICRSTMAEFVLKNMVQKQGLQDEFYIESAGTSREEIGNDTHHGTKAKLKEMNIPFTKRHARQVTKADYNNFNYLICMDKNNLRNLARIIGTDTENKVSLLLDFANEHKDIADPWYTGNFDETYEDDR
ncbi:MAG: low molecular weight protein-tyrosine-phosphatase [Clostridia bacterium]